MVDSRYSNPIATEKVVISEVMEVSVLNRSVAACVCSTSRVIIN